jgi:hypothetical protein
MIAFLHAAWIAALVGCGGGDQVDVYPVKGLVKYQGKPMVGGGSIAFIPTTSQEAKAAGGIIKEDGTYEMTTYEEGDGSAPGNYRVVIHQVVVSEPPATQDGQAPVAAAGSTVPQADQIPPIYSDTFNSPLTAKVEAIDSNEINFELTKQ